MPDHVNQSKAHAGRNIVGGNLVEQYLARNPGKVEQLLERLREAVGKNETIKHHIPNFAFYHVNKTPKDGIEGLSGKLEHVGRADLVEDAADRLVLFKALLDDWSAFMSAQMIFAHLLSLAENNFKVQVYPDCCSGLCWSGIDKKTSDHVVAPLVEECAPITEFSIDTNMALGLLYWLADKCFIKWHK